LQGKINRAPIGACQRLCGTRRHEFAVQSCDPLVAD
jgi:hypothetical protein